MKKVCFISFLLLTAFCAAQNVSRPPIWGIAKMTYLISSEQLANRYYHSFLGFDYAFSYPSKEGVRLVYKVNDRQFLEFIVDSEAKQKNRFVSVSFETESCSQMEQYLRSKGVVIDKPSYTDKAGNKVLLIHDPSGVAVEFVEFMPASLHMKSKGHFLSANRISTRIHHAGLFTKEMIDAPVFYTQILGCKLVIRYPQSQAEMPKMLYFQLPDCAEMIENYSPSNDQNFCHPCFVTLDIQEVFYKLKERRTVEKLGIPMVGKGKRWLLNMTNADGTKVEFTEPYIATF